jgi:hypothetical protein
MLRSIDTARLTFALGWLGPSLLLLLLALLVGTSSAGAETMRFELTDGSVITGELVGAADGVLSIDSPALGRLSVPQSSVVSMTAAGTMAVPAPGGPAPASTPSGIDEAQMMAMQQKMMADPAFLERMGALQSNPLMQEILSDPELMQKVLAGDVEALARDPRIQQLSEDPAVRSLSESIAE